MTPLNLNLDDDLRTRIEARAAENGFATVEAYVEAMLLADAAGGPMVEEDELESLLLARLNGPFVDVDEADFDQMRQKLKDRLHAGGEHPEPAR